MAESLDMPLRVRLSIDRNAAELHSLAWEALCDPETGALLATREQMLFSRFISSEDWRPVHLRPRDEMRALVAIANPANVSSYHPEVARFRPWMCPAKRSARPPVSRTFQ